MGKYALIIGNSDGIGLGTTKTLLEAGWQVAGLSRSESSIDHPNYSHEISEVQQADYSQTLMSILEKNGPFDVCMYCAGIGELLDPDKMEEEIQVFEVNLMGLVKTVSIVITQMVKQGRGHFIGLSSVADVLWSGEAPSYHATKAGFSNYLESLSMALKPKGVHVTNLRFGFVDTKMAKGDVKPFMISVDKAVQHVLRCIDKKPVRYTAPWIMIPLVNFRRFMQNLSIKSGLKFEVK